MSVSFRMYKYCYSNIVTIYAKGLLIGLTCKEMYETVCAWIKPL